MDEFAEQQAPRRRGSSGCLWGCLGAVLLVFLAVGGTIGVTAWSLYQSFRNDPELTTIVEIARADQRISAIVGGSFTVTEIERRSFPTKTGQAESYHLVLIGTNGESTLDVRLEPSGGGMKIVTMTLTGPDGQTVWLKGGAPNPWMRAI